MSSRLTIGHGRVVPRSAACSEGIESVRGSPGHHVRGRDAAVRREDRPVDTARAVRLQPSSGDRARLRGRRGPLIAGRPSALLSSRAHGGERSLGGRRASARRVVRRSFRTHREIAPVPGGSFPHPRPRPVLRAPGVSRSRSRRHRCSVLVGGLWRRGAEGVCGLPGDGGVQRGELRLPRAQDGREGAHLRDPLRRSLRPGLAGEHHGRTAQPAARGAASLHHPLRGALPHPVFRRPAAAHVSGGGKARPGPRRACGGPDRSLHPALVLGDQLHPRLRNGLPERARPPEAP